MFGDKMIQRWEGNGKMSKVPDTQHTQGFYCCHHLTCLEIRRRMGEDGLLVRCSHH
jgi:hypothetical protein